MRRMIIAAGLAGVALGAAGCGSTQSSSQASAPLVRAADVTAKVPGYRVQGLVTVSTPLANVQTSMAGYIDRTTRTGQMSTHERVAGHVLNLREKFSGLTVWMSAAGLPRFQALAHGKPWIKMDLSRAFGALGLSSLPTSGADPSQFVDYLRAVSVKTRRLGTAMIRGVATTEYRAVVDLNRYTKLLPPARRASATHAITTLESLIGSHLLPMNAWIDGHQLVRRVSTSYQECVVGQHVRFSMTMDMFGFGPQPSAALPTTAQSYDLTPLLAAQLNKVKLGCGTST